MTDTLMAAVERAKVGSHRHDVAEPGELYLVWSNEHRAWWRPGRMGYTTSVLAAGTYPRDEAIRICASWSSKCAPDEVPVALADAVECVEPSARAALAVQP